MSLPPELYTWVERGAYALFLFDSFTDGFMHVVDLGAGALLAYVCQKSHGYYLRFAGDGHPPREFPKDDVKILGQVSYICVSMDPPVYWEMSDMKREKVENIYERPLLKVSAK